MPTIITHGFIGHVAGKALISDQNRHVTFRLLTVALPIIPDIDTLFMSWVPYSHALGHRGLSHSLFFALLLALLGTLFIYFADKDFPLRKAYLVLFFFILTAHHGLLDMATDGGLGIAIFAPFDNTRYFFTWRPIPAAPLHPGSMFTLKGFLLLGHEIILIWPPVVVLFIVRKIIAKLVR